MPGKQDEKMMMTVFLKHQQTMNLDEIGEKLRSAGFWTQFPPEDVEVVSWYVMMGIGQVVTLRFHPAKLRDINLAIEKSAWGAFETEFYPTYDFRKVFEQKRAEASQ